MKFTNRFFAAALGVLLSGPALAQGLLECEFKAIVPADADFFTSRFRAAPQVGTRVTIDFDSQLITSMTFADGSVFFSPGEATLARLTTFGVFAGFGGVRIGANGTYVAELTAPQPQDEGNTTYTSRFAITQAYRGDAFHLVTTATHYADLECKPLTHAD